MDDGEDNDDQPPQGEAKETVRLRISSRTSDARTTNSAYGHSPESDDEISDEDFTIVDSSPP